MAQSLTFRGYRSGTTLFTAMLAVVAGFVQSQVDSPGEIRVDHYLVIWLSAALLGMGAVWLSFVVRRGERGPIDGSLTLAAVEAFLPSIVAGVLVTYAITYHHLTAEKFALLPGLWMVLYSMGLFASRRLLPRAVFIAAGFYLLCGLFVLTRTVDVACSPWTMSSVFGVGQALSAGMLYFTLERQPEVCLD